MANLVFDAFVAGVPADAAFLRFPDGRQWSYGELRDRAGRMANALVAAGVAPGDRVAVQVEKSAEALVLYLASVRTGAVFLPLNTGYTESELAYFFGDARPRLIVVDPGTAAMAEPLAAKARATLLTLDADGGGSLIDKAADMPAHFTNAPAGEDTLAALLYTSGTTGRSKGAMLTHRNLVSNALTLRDVWRVTAADRLIHMLPIFHTHGLFVATNVTLAAAASMDFHARFDPDAVIDAMASATMLMGVPTHYTRLLASPRLTPEATAGMRLFVSGSAPLLAETHRAFRERTGQAILERYGMTETGMNTSNPYDGERKAGTVGFPLPGVEIRVTDSATALPVASGEIGMIEVRGPNVFVGYWEMPEKTAESFRADGFFITGDVGRFDEEGYIEIVGRDKDLIITGGLNVYPKEVETVIDALPGVIESAVIGLPHPDFGEGVTAVVAARNGATVTEDAIREGLAGQLARFKQPKRVLVVDELPRNAMGKVQKAALRQQYAGLYQA